MKKGTLEPMNKLLCNHEVSYIKEKGKLYGADIGDLSKSFVSEQELRYAGRSDFFVINDPDGIKESKMFPNMKFYRWKL